MVYRDDKRLRAIAVKTNGEASRKTVEKKRDDKPSRESGWLDLNRIRVSVDPRQEWRQMLREVWRLQRDHFWVPDMSGNDWSAIYAQYEPLLDRVSTRAELSDLIWELQGELGTSHAYEMGGDHRKPPSVALGHLGADLRATATVALRSHTLLLVTPGMPARTPRSVQWVSKRKSASASWQ